MVGLTDILGGFSKMSLPSEASGLADSACQPKIRSVAKVRVKTAAERFIDALLLDHWLFKTRFPDFMIIGVQKSGTSTLHQLLSQHPRLKGSQRKELHYFDTPASRRPSLKHYQKNFRKLFYDRSLTFESTPKYIFVEQVAAELFRHNLLLKILVNLRDPVSRAFSAWNMHKMNLAADRKHGAAIKIDPKFGQFLQQEFGLGTDQFPTFDQHVERALDPMSQDDYGAVIERGIYHTQLERYFKHFPRGQFLILEFEEFVESPRQTLHQITDFLEVPRYQSYVIHKINEGFCDSKISSDAQSRLKKFYQPQNQKLYQLLGRRFDWD